MRISDWSSDVCSSDLNDAPTDWDHERRGAGNAADRQSHNAAHNSLVESGRRRQRHDSDKANASCPEYKVYGSACDNHASLRDIHAGSVERSEEHTSELQSLMRISYAVFCLTKKQTSSKRQSHIQIKMKHNIPT